LWWLEQFSAGADVTVTSAPLMKRKEKNETSGNVTYRQDGEIDRGYRTAGRNKLY